MTRAEAIREAKQLSVIYATPYAVYYDGEGHEDRQGFHAVRDTESAYLWYDHAPEYQTHP